MTVVSSLERLQEAVLLFDKYFIFLAVKEP